MEEHTEARPLFLSTVWLGQQWDVSRGATDPTPLCWSLSLTPSAEYPSAFGATRSSTPKILHGVWTSATKSLRVVCTSLHSSSQDCIYEGTLRINEEDGSITLLGSFHEASTGARGSFLVYAERENPSVHISGLWIGQAVPDDSLADFAIPINPIRWTLSILNSATNEGESLPEVFGSGYFDDAADVPGRPLLFYALQGSREEGGTKLKIIKRYQSDETSANTAAYLVDYVGDLNENEPGGEREQEGGWTLSGSWTNPEGGSFGQFRCFRENVGGFNTFSTFCAVCQRVIRPGETRFVAVDVLEEWGCCESCQQSGGAQQRRVESEVVLASEVSQGSCCASVAADALLRFSSRPFLGTRTPTTGFKWETYREVGGAAGSVARGLLKMLQWDGKQQPRPVFVLLADLSPAYVCCLLAGLLAGCVLVPLHGALEPESLASCFTLVQPAAVFVGAEYVEKAAKTLALSQITPKLTAVLKHTTLPSTAPSPEGVEESHRDTLFSLDIEAIATLGGTSGEGEVTLLPREIDEVTAILFTSGSSGVPKGVAYTEKLLRPSEGASNVVPLVKLDIQPFHPSFIVSLLSVMKVGGRRAISTDLGTVLEDARLTRPTHISAPPIFWTMLQREHAARMATLVAHNASLPAENRRTNGQMLAQVSREVRLLLGNRLVAVATGGAAVPASTLQFVREQLGVELSDLYGSRETGGIARDGVVYPGVDVVLLPVPEMGYYPTGDPPRGEIVVHSARLFSGYFKNLTATSASFVEIDGKQYYRTGDIGERSGGKLRIIDRCGAVVKLAQSEWLSPTRVEIVLESSPLVAQAFVLALAGHKYPVAVVVPSAVMTSRMKNESASAESVLLKELRFWCVHHHLRAFEVPQAVAIEHNPWTPQNGFLTSTLKKRRGPLVAAYKKTCEELYESLETKGRERGDREKEDEEVPRLSASFNEMLQRVLGESGSNVDPAATLSEVGADSMASARLATLLSAEGVPVSSRTIHSYPLAHLDALLRNAQAGGYIPPPTPVADVIDWTAEQTLPTTLPLTPSAKAPREERGDIFVTGGTGFLGPYLVGAILQGHPHSHARVFVLVRGESIEVVQERLRADMVRAGVYQESQWERVRVVVGDLGRPRFGVSESQWESLIESVGEIFHSGAKVDVTLPYTALRKVNVEGTLTVIEMAILAGARVHYVSSASALPSSDPQEAWTATPIDGEQLALKGGYGATKAVSERLLYEASRTHSLDVRVMRPSAICGDATGEHPWNESDFSFMLLGAIATLGVSVSPAPVKLHWVPVDFVARAVVSLAASPSGRVFNLCGEGPALEEAVTALTSAGLSIKSIRASEWAREVQRLCEGQQQQRVSVLAEDVKRLDFNGGDLVVPTQRTRESLRECGIEWPEITAELLAACSKWVRAVNAH